jgi:hypothetical protein
VSALRHHAGTLVVLLLVVVCLLWAMAWMSSSLSAMLDVRSMPIPPPPSGLIGTGGDGGYWDTPCSDIRGCPSPVPAVDPGDAALAVPLRVASLEIPVDHAGHYAIPVGTAMLPNGILTDASMALADNIRMDLHLEPSVLDLVLTGEDGERLTNVYEQGWRPGTEKVDVRIEFDVVSLDAPTSITVTDIVVR